MSGGITVILGVVVLVVFIWSLFAGLGDDLWLLIKGLISLMLIFGGLLVMALGLSELWEQFKSRREQQAAGATTGEKEQK
ncbi:MAG TPA: hypothetical protein EYP85_03980 [Armatimonadetes bacterium]|nr:hypothetical protein [Armatimonadota bacterium]